MHDALKPLLRAVAQRCKKIQPGERLDSIDRRNIGTQVVVGARIIPDALDYSKSDVLPAHGGAEGMNGYGSPENASSTNATSEILTR